MNVRQRHQMVLKLVTCLIKVVHAVDAHELFRLQENIVVDDLGKVLFQSRGNPCRALALYRFESCD